MDHKQAERKIITDLKQGQREREKNVADLRRFSLKSPLSTTKTSPVILKTALYSAKKLKPVKPLHTRNPAAFYPKFPPKTPLLPLKKMRPSLPNILPSSRFPLLLLLLPLFLFIFHLHRSPKPSSLIPPIPPQITDPHILFLSFSSSSNSSISSHLQTLTLKPHLAGTPSSSSSAAYVLHHLHLAGLQTLTLNYSPLLSYPSSSSLSIHINQTLIKNLSLAEPADPAGHSVPPYHSYSPSGAVFAPAVYVNLGRDEDYGILDRLSVEVSGCVAVVRRGGGARGAVVEAAAARGVKAVVMFGKGIGGGVERGTVLLGGAGDPLTPGWAAEAMAERLGLDDEKVRKRFPRIPSMPVSIGVAVEILGAIGGPLAPLEWTEDMPEVVGVGGGFVMVNFTYQV